MWNQYQNGAGTGRTRRVERCRASVPYGHWNTTTLVAGLSIKGIIATIIISSAVNGDIFNAYIEKIIAPVLRPDDIVTMNNLPVHKATGICEKIEACGASLMYVPPYTPDFNPIEKVFSQIKA